MSTGKELPWRRLWQDMQPRMITMGAGRRLISQGKSWSEIIHPSTSCSPWTWDKQTSHFLCSYTAQSVILQNNQARHHAAFASSQHSLWKLHFHPTIVVDHLDSYLPTQSLWWCLGLNHHLLGKLTSALTDFSPIRGNTMFLFLMTMT